MTRQTVKITVYSLDPKVCHLCNATERWLSRKKIEFTKVRMDQDAEAAEYVKSLGYGPGSSAPVVVVEDGESVTHWSGFSETRINSLAV